MTPTALLDAVAAADAVVRRGEVDRLEAVLAWAHAHPVGKEDTAASWLVDRSVFAPVEEGEDRLGGEGTPPVAEFAVEQLATRLDISSFAAMSLVGDVLDLAHRHPSSGSG
ncbi:MAG: hypothetical protein ACTHJH_12095 [Marmoricola sp.]